LPGYFFHSSALVKFYHIELGTPAVQQIVNLTGSVVPTSRLTITELISAFAIQVRTGAIEPDDARIFRNQLRNDVAAGKFQVFSIAEGEFLSAELLLDGHAPSLRLRALDALQLAVAMELRAHGLVDYFVAADKPLCQLAEQEQFHVINSDIG
jgi:uncharacterized protein